MKPFVVSPDVSFPPDSATSTFAILGTRGSGKSYGAGVLVESFLSQQVQVVVVDVVGTWWGLRLGADGKSPGFDIPVFGGIHGDVPLAPTAGGLVAQLIAERGMSMVLDISDFTIGQQRRFVTDLAHDVFQLKKRNPSPVHFVFEEGHEFFPQFVDASAAQLVGATTRLWKIGRNYGIGGTIVTQRAAETNKSALNLTDRIITGQLKAPEDIKRIDGWANSNGVSDAMVMELPKLAKGTLIVWEETGAVRTVFRAKTTFDASRTPDGTISRKKLAPIDLDAVREAMAATIEEAKANDPRELRAHIAELEKRLKAVPTPSAKAVEKPVLKEADLKRIEAAEKRTEALADRWLASTQELKDVVRELAVKVADALTPPRVITQADFLDAHVTHFARTHTPVLKGVPDTGVSYAPKPTALTAPPEGISKYAFELLKVVASRGSASDSQISTLSGYRRTSSGFGKALAELIAAGLIEGDKNNRGITHTGRVMAGEVEKPPTGARLLDHWMAKLTTAEARVLCVVYKQEGQPISHNGITIATGYSQTSSGFGRAIGGLRKLGLVTTTKDTVTISPAFLE
jgi:hypothetical protein